MPDPISVILLGRLAVDLEYARKGIGRALMRDCYLRYLKIVKSVGSRALLVHALDDESMAYYLNLGFTQSPVNPHTLMILTKQMEASLAASDAQ